MMSSSRSVAVTLSFHEGRIPDFWSLAPVISTCLRQADLLILHQDVAMRGDRMDFETDHGRIALQVEPRGALTVSTDVDAICPYETARQICFLLGQRMAARFAVRSVHWHPTTQTLSPRGFTWAALDDMPYRFGADRGGQPPSYFI